ncbi:hypothetical protein OK016_04050 [Vibrio chagasii]|nr:hypothetical protein [Vibrio chagasii]
MLLVGIVIAVGMKFVGALIMTSPLIHPCCNSKKGFSKAYTLNK